MSKRCYVCNAHPGDVCRASDGEIAECPRASMTIKRTDPTKSLLQGCSYTHSTMSNIRERFTRILAEQAAAVRAPNVQPLRRKAKP